MESTLEQLQSQLAELQARLAETEAKRVYLTEHFSETVAEQAEKRAQELLQEKQQAAKESVRQQLREAALPAEPQTYCEYKSLTVAQKSALIESKGKDAEAYINELLRRQRIADEAAKRAAILEQMAKKNPRL